MTTMAEKKEKEKVQDPEEELVIVEDESELSGDHDDEHDDDDEGDERTAQTPEEEDDDEDEERAAIRKRRKEEKIQRKKIRDENIKRNRIEMDFLRKRNDDLERRLSAQEQRAYTGDLNNLDAAINEAIKEVGMADQVIAKAVTSGNGDDVAQALKYRDQAMERARQYQMQKQQAQQAPQRQAPAIDERTMQYAKEFMAENPWYDAQGRNEDSAVVIAIDQAVVKDGFDPTTKEYWTELRSRASRRLPERFKKQTGRVSRGGPEVGSGREYAPTSTRKEVYISPERKAALIEAGAWDDPVLRAKYVKRYAEYDRAHKS
jgi:hypothetical protein